MPRTDCTLRYLSRVTVLLVFLAGVFACPARAVCTKPRWFGPATFTVTGPNPSAIAIADFNGDGISDLAVANSAYLSNPNNGNVSVLLGQGVGGVGNGAFATPSPIAAGPGPTGIVAADFDEDGITDLVVTNINANTVSFLHGNGSGGVGNGTFAPPLVSATGPAPHQLVTNDFDEDGILDLAVVNNSVNSISVLSGLGSGGVGNGSFGSPRIYALHNRPLSIASGDLNEDGVLDLITTEYTSGTIAVLLGHGVGGVGDGTFAIATHYPAGIEPTDIAVGDIDEDGVPDLVVSNGTSGGLAFLRGQGVGGVGNGTFVAPQFFGPGTASAVRVADVNGDGSLDVLACYTNPTVRTHVASFRGNGDGTFAAPETYAAGIVPRAIALGQFDGSPEPDIAVPNTSANDICVLLGRCEDDPRAPHLDDVRDVPNDQGGKVFVTWGRSSLDVSGGPVNAYRVWRRIPPGAATIRLQEARDLGIEIGRPHVVRRAIGEAIEYWEALATLPAQRLDGYGFTAATTQDSLRGSNPYTAFFITALTSNIDVFYDSAVDSGYSVDNLPPRRPSGFTAYAGARGMSLHWDPNTESDLFSYELYRGATEAFEPSPESLIAAPEDTGHVDVAGAPGDYYKLLAVDVHGNRSEPAQTRAPETLSGTDSEHRFALRGARPNPASRDLNLVFSLPDAAPAVLEVLDLGGRRVLSRNVGALGAGSHILKLANVPELRPGVYVVRLGRAGQSLSTKVVLFP